MAHTFMCLGRIPTMIIQHQEQAHPTRLPRRMTSMRVPASFHSATLSSIMSLVT